MNFHNRMMVTIQLVLYEQIADRLTTIVTNKVMLQAAMALTLLTAFVKWEKTHQNHIVNTCLLRIIRGKLVKTLQNYAYCLQR
jgi:hypothetical protein